MKKNLSLLSMKKKSKFVIYEKKIKFVIYEKKTELRNVIVLKRWFTKLISRKLHQNYPSTIVKVYGYRNR